MMQDGEKNKKLKASEQVTFVQPRRMIILTSVLMILIVAMGIVATLSARSFWLRTFMMMSIAWFSAVTIKQLLRLNETIRLTKEGISLNSPRASISISWPDIARVTRRTSLLERDQLVIESRDGKRITVGEQLIGYYDLCELVNQSADPSRRSGLSRDLTIGVRNYRTSVAEQSAKLRASASELSVVGCPKCVECGSDELMPLKASLANFYVACAVCGRVRRKDIPANLGWWIRFASRAWFILNSLMWTVALSVLWPLALMLLVSVGYAVVWAVWNLILGPLAGTERFSILELSNFVRWLLPGFIVSLLLLAAAVRYLPKRLLPALFHGSSLRKKSERNV